MFVFASNKKFDSLPNLMQFIYFCDQSNAKSKSQQ